MTVTMTTITMIIANGHYCYDHDDMMMTTMAMITMITMMTIIMTQITVMTITNNNNDYDDDCNSFQKTITIMPMTITMTIPTTKVTLQ